jgi:type VI secretion system protein ImpK
MIDQRLAVPNRTRAQGRADTDPVAPNDSAENRAHNRRVEVTLLLSPQERDRELTVAPVTK